MSNGSPPAAPPRSPVEPIPALLIVILILGLIYIAKPKHSASPPSPTCQSCKNGSGSRGETAWVPFSTSSTSIQPSKDKWQPFEPPIDSRQKTWGADRESEPRKRQWAALEEK